MRSVFGVLTAMILVLGFGGAARAATPTPAECSANYQMCDAACDRADPQHGLSYAGCSAKCVAKKAACEGEIVYDKSADWAENTAKPWFQDKIHNAPANTEHTYPDQNRDAPVKK